MWMQLRYFGLSGLRSRLQAHLDLARELATSIEADPDAELLYPVPLRDGLLPYAAGALCRQGRGATGRGVP